MQKNIICYIKSELPSGNKQEHAFKNERGKPGNEQGTFVVLQHLEIYTICDITVITFSL